MMNLWSIARSPLIIGGNMPKNDEFTLTLLTNDEMIKVNQKSTNGRQLFRNGDQIAWVADAEGSGNKYVALFNATTPPARGRGRRGAAAEPGTETAAAAVTAPEAVTVSVPMADLKLPAEMRVVNVRDLWLHKDLGAKEAVSAELAPHASALFEVQVGK